HTHPETGGTTEIPNLHPLCWRHHQMKTAGLLDPIKESITHPTTPTNTQFEPGTTPWTIRHRPPRHTLDECHPITPAPVPTSSPPGSYTPSPPQRKNSNSASPTTTTPTHPPTPNHHRSDTRRHLLFCLVSGYAQWCAHVGTRITREGPAWQSCCHAGPPRAHL